MASVVVCCDECIRVGKSIVFFPEHCTIPVTEVSETSYSFLCIIIVRFLYLIFDRWSSGCDLISQYFFSSFLTCVENSRWSILVMLIVTCVFQIAYFPLSILVVRSFGWRIYKRVGANVTLQKLYRTYQVGDYGVLHAFHKVTKEMIEISNAFFFLLLLGIDFIRVIIFFFFFFFSLFYSDFLCRSPRADLAVSHETRCSSCPTHSRCCMYFFVAKLDDSCLRLSWGC